MDLAPPTLLTLVVIGSLAAAQVMPLGVTTVLVRVSDTTTKGALLAAAAADSALVSQPAPGFAVLYGDASHIRNRLGLAVRWQGSAPCGEKL
jgi:hypothetical protein